MADTPSSITSEIKRKKIKNGGGFIFVRPSLQQLGLARFLLSEARVSRIGNFLARVSFDLCASYKGE
jgi:hypothetical protein